MKEANKQTESNNDTPRLEASSVERTVMPGFSLKFKIDRQINEKEEVGMLMYILRKAKEAADSGRRGVILCQVWGDDSDSFILAEGKFVDHDLAKKIIELTFKA